MEKGENGGSGCFKVLWPGLCAAREGVWLMFSFVSTSPVSGKRDLLT